MCGRYTARKIDLRRFGILDDSPDWFEEFSEQANLALLSNIAPSMNVPIIRLDSKGNGTPAWPAGA